MGRDVSRAAQIALSAREASISRPSVARSTFTMSTATTLSRLTGFVRMWATAFALGATGLMSSYSVANNIPNMVFELVAGGIIASLFIPTFMELKERDGDAGAWRFASHVFNLALIALGTLALIGTIFPWPFIWTQTFRFEPGTAVEIRATASYFFSFFAIQIVIYGAGTILSALLNARRQYLWPALGPVFNNIVVIATMFAFAALRDNLPLARVVLAVGTTLGVVAMFGVQVPSLVRSGIQYTRSIGLRDPAVRRMLVLAVPTLVYVFTNLVAVSVRNASAFAVADNGPSILLYAWTFYQLPYGILAVALATAVFTELSEKAGRRDTASFKDTFGRGLRATGVLILPTSAIVVALARPLVSLYRVGEFKQADVPAVAQVLQLWAMGLVFYASTMFVLRTFYSLKDTRTPMYVNLALTAVQITLYTVLSTGIAGWGGLGINGIPIADVVFFVLSFFTLAFLLRRRIGGYDASGVAWVFIRVAVASVAGGVVAWLVARALAAPASGVTGSLLQVFAGGTAGLTVALTLSRLMGVREAAVVTEFVSRAVHKRRNRKES
jgi:putative peptidoglycan lipid II flippase